MCISLATAALIGAGTAAVGAVSSLEQGRRSRSQARSAERAMARTEADAANAGNARVAQRRRALARNSLMAAPGTDGQSGRQTLGG